MSRLKYVCHCLCNALYVYCRGRAVTNVGKTCDPTPCFVLAINTFKLTSFCLLDLFFIIACVDGEVMVDNNFTSSRHPLMAFGRDVFVFVKEKNLISSIWIVI